MVAQTCPRCLGVLSEGHVCPDIKAAAHGYADDLREDRRMYGSSFERADLDGTRHRIDPLNVYITRHNGVENFVLLRQQRGSEMNNPIMRYFAFKHLPQKLGAVSAEVYALAESMNAQLPDGAEKSAGLRKLLEAKDCFVRAALDAPTNEHA